MRYNNPLRIFLDCHVFDGEFQGTRTYLEGLYTELVKHKEYHFFLAADDIAGLQEVFGKQDNITYVRYKPGGKAYRLLADSPRLIRKHKIDLAHFQYRVPPVKLCKYITTIHDVLFEDFPEYFPPLSRKVNYHSYRLSAKASNILLTVSAYSKQKIEQHLGTAVSGITPNAVSDVFYEAYDKEAVRAEVKKRYGFENYLLYTSRWEPRKKQDLLLKAFAELGLHKTHALVFVGEESIVNPNYDQIYQGLDDEVKAKIFRLGKVNFPDMLTLLRGAQLFVYPSIAEGFGIPPLEAIAAGVPVISSDRTAMADFDFIGKYRFNPENESEFRHVLFTALQEYDMEALAHMQDVVKSRYTWKHAASEYINAVNRFVRPTGS